MSSEHWPIGTEAELEALEEALDELKHYWSTNQTEKIPGPLERARALADGLEGEPADDGDGEFDLPKRFIKSDSFVAEDLYPDRDELMFRVREHARERFAPLPGSYEFEDVEVDRIFIEDGVVNYRVSHPEMGVFQER